MFKYLYFFIILTAFTACRSAMNNPSSPQYSPIVEIETSLGTIVVQLSHKTPRHRDNFLKLVKNGFYHDINFHRIINNFMIQGGDPNARAAGATYEGEDLDNSTIAAEFDSTLFHYRGALCAARMGDQVNPTRASSATQFYIVQAQNIQPQLFDQLARYKGYTYTAEQEKAYKEQGGTPHLDREYTVFGKVIDGMDVVDKIAAVATNGAGQPNEPIKIISTKIRK